MTSSANQATTISRQATGDTTNLPNIQYAMRFQRNSGQTGVAAIYNFSSFESVNSIPFAGKTVTMSFYARKGADYSATSNLLSVGLNTGTGTDQAFFSMTGATNAILSNATLTTTWQRFTFVSPVGVAATATQLAPYFIFTPTGTAGANDYYEVTGVQIDIGSVALPFRTYAATLQGELAACQRYYWRQSSDATTLYAVFGVGAASNTTTTNIYIKNPVSMRISPSILDYANLAVDDGVTTTAVTSATISNVLSNSNGVNIAAVVASGLTQYRPYRLLTNNTASGYVGISAEL